MFDAHSASTTHCSPRACEPVATHSRGAVRTGEVGSAMPQVCDAGHEPSVQATHVPSSHIPLAHPPSSPHGAPSGAGAGTIGEKSQPGPSVIFAPICAITCL